MSAQPVRGRRAPSLDDKRLWSIEELCEFLGDIPKATVYKWRALGTGPAAYRLGKHLKFDPRDVADWLKDRKDEI